MTHVQDNLRKMSPDAAETRTWFLSSQIEPAPYLRELQKTVERLQAKIDTAFVPRARLDPEKVWEKWLGKQLDLQELDSAEIRTLCISPATAMRQKLIDALLYKPDALKSFRTFCGFVKAYFEKWRIMESPEQAETLILRVLHDGRIQRKSRVLDVWRSSVFLFSAQADRRMGSIVSQQHKPLKDVCADFFIDTSSPLAAAAYAQAASLAVDSLINRQGNLSEIEVLHEFRWISENLLTRVLKPDAYRAAFAKLILSRLPELQHLFQTVLVDLIHADERLGDPRLPSCAPNWRTMPAGAQDRFLAWLAKETLQFFFNTLVPKNDENRRRAEFWMEYAKKQGTIKDFQVAVSAEDLPKIRSSRAKTIPTFSSIYGGKTSAFLMVFAGYGVEYVVIEFSETGNAAYIYARKVFEAHGIRLRSNSFDRRGDLLRMDEAQDRIIHFDGGRVPWEQKARSKLAELGIRP